MVGPPPTVHQSVQQASPNFFMALKYTLAQKTKKVQFMPLI